MDKKVIDQIANLILADEYDEAKDALDGIMENLQFDIDDWMIESEEDEKHVDALQKSLEILEDVWQELDDIEELDIDKDEIINHLGQVIQDN